MSWNNGLRLTVAVVAVASFAVPAFAETGKDDLKDWVGSWGCHAESDFSGPDDPFEFVQISNLDIAKDGQVTGNIIQAIPEIPSTNPELRLVCTLVGEASTNASVEGYLRLDSVVVCEGEGLDQPFEFDAEAECVGVLNAAGSGYLGMYCIDLADEPGVTVESLATCERQELRGDRR
jgi:hypothetical protein